MSADAGDEDTLLTQIAGGGMRALEALYRLMRVELPAGTVRWRYRVALGRLRPLMEEVAW